MAKTVIPLIRKHSDKVLDVYEGDDHVATITELGKDRIGFRIMWHKSNILEHNLDCATWSDLMSTMFGQAAVDLDSFGGEEGMDRFFNVTVH